MSSQNGTEQQSYPVRDRYFSHRFVRVLHKSCAAQDIGPAACFLLCIIAHTEDAARYRGPARFWNSQLMETLGFRSPKQLDEARDKAVAAGWLVYQRGTNRTVGNYWVTIPQMYQTLTDEAIEPIPYKGDNHSEYGTNSGTNTGRISDELRNEKVTESGKPSNPIPIPNPIPNKHTPDGGVGISEKKKKQSASSDMPGRVKSVQSEEIPEDLRTPAFVECWQRWIAYRTQLGKGKAMTVQGQQAAFVRVREIGLQTAIAKLTEAMANGWQGWDFGGGSSQQQAPPPKPAGPSVHDLYPPFKAQPLNRPQQ